MADTTDDRTVAEQMLEGEICEGCQKPLHGTPPGHPRRCAYCKRDAPQEPVINEGAGVQITPPGQRQRAKASGPLPKWAREAIAAGDPIVLRYHCAFCPERHFGAHAALVDHLRDVHGVTTP